MEEIRREIHRRQNVRIGTKKHNINTQMKNILL